MRTGSSQIMSSQAPRWGKCKQSSKFLREQENIFKCSFWTKGTSELSYQYSTFRRTETHPEETLQERENKLSKWQALGMIRFTFYVGRGPWDTDQKKYHHSKIDSKVLFQKAKYLENIDTKAKKVYYISKSPNFLNI